MAVAVRKEKENYVSSEALPASIKEKSHLGPKHRATPPPAKKTRGVSGDQGDD